MNIDAHQHFWVFSEAEYPWIQAGWPIRRSFLPDDLEPLLKAHDMNGCVAVQARQSLTESQWLLELADRHPMIKGVVGWVDLLSDLVEEQLARFAEHPKFAGVRHVVQDEPDDRFMCGKDFQNGIAKLHAHGLTYDILVFPRQLPAAVELVQRFPDQPFVLDHIAKPSIREGSISPWREEIRELAQAPHVMCKVSGMVTEASWQDWNREDFVRYLDVVFECFGPERIMFGSDWPVCLLAAHYDAVYDLVTNYTKNLSAESRLQIFGGNAVQFYGLNEPD